MNGKRSKEAERGLVTRHLHTEAAQGADFTGRRPKAVARVLEAKARAGARHTETVTEAGPLWGSGAALRTRRAVGSPMIGDFEHKKRKEVSNVVVNAW